MKIQPFFVRAALFLFLLVAIALGFLMSWPVVPATPKKTPEYWQALARTDLAAAHAAILAAHPGVIDQSNPGFADWTRNGYRDALALLPNVESYDTALSAVRYYTTGFNDGHLSYSDNIRSNTPILINGWGVSRSGNDYVVQTVARNWEVPLPPLGAVLVDCDGRAVSRIIEQDVAPFVDRRNLPSVMDDVAGGLIMLHPSGRRLKHCRFNVSGKIIGLPVKYAAITPEQYFALERPSTVHSEVGNSFTFKNGTLWIDVANFKLQPATSDAANLERMLAQLRALRGVERIVFDTRHNTGGDSAVGERIFEAATGGLVLDKRKAAQLPRTFAQWRVSDVAVATWVKHLETRAHLYGETSAEAQQAAAFLKQLKAAQAAGTPWIDQDGGHRLTRDDATRLGARLKNFRGQLALLTNNSCASACLDFADLVRQVPGSLHVGKTTSADSVYIDMGLARLPSGNHLSIPLKVWRNRVRANNETLLPHMQLDVNLANDEQVMAATLAALRRARTEGIPVLDRNPGNPAQSSAGILPPQRIVASTLGESKRSAPSSAATPAAPAASTTSP